MTDRTVICLGAGPNQLPLICEARKLGFRVVAVDRNPQSPGMTVADVTIVESTHDADAVIAHLREYGNSYHGLLARTCGPPLVTAAKVCETFGIAGITATLAELAIQKSSLRAFAASHGIPMASGWLNTLPAEEIKFPLIVKPDLTVVGKKDVVVVSNPAALECAITAARRSSGNNLAEIEMFVEGCDVTWLTLLHQGHSFPLFALDELVGINPAGKIKGLGVSMPTVTTGSVCVRGMLSVMEQFASLFPDVRAILAFSFRVDRQRLRPLLIEIHADMTGDLILDVLLPHAYKGENILHKVVEVALGGRPFRLAPEDSLPTAILYTGSSYDIIQGSTISEILEEVKRQAGEFAFSHLEMAELL